MSTRSPILALKENMLLSSDRDVWGYYRLIPKNICQNNPEMVQKNKEAMDALFTLIAPYEDFELRMVSEVLDLERKFDDFSEAFDPEIKELGEYYAKETVKILREEGDVYQPSFILGVKIKDGDIADSFKDIFRKVLGRLVEDILSLFGYEPENLDVYFEEVKSLEEELENLLYSYSIRPLTAAEMRYFNRLQYIRGLYHRVEDEDHWQLIEDIESAIISPAKNVSGVLKIVDELGTSYLSFLPISKLPENLKNLDLYEYGQNCSFPLELLLKGHAPLLHGASGVYSKLGWLGNRFKGEQAEAEISGDEPSDHTLTLRFLVKHLKQKIDLKEAIFDWLGSFVVWGKTEQEVRDKSLFIIKSLNTYLEVSRAKFDQVQLFYLFLMGRKLGNQTNWVQRTGTQGLAELSFGTSTALGTNIGWYIGRIDRLGADGVQGEATTLDELIHASNRYVFFNSQGIAEGIKGALFDSPHMAVTGKTGKGKTFLVGLLFLYSTFLCVQSLFIDPKAEKKKWFMKIINSPYFQSNYPLFVDHLKSFHYVSLDVSKKENYGALDPFVYLGDVEVQEVAIDMINELSPLRDNYKLKGAVSEAIKTVLERRRIGQQVGLLDVVEWLKEQKDEMIREYGKFLYLTVKDSVLRLGFSHGENRGLDFTEKTTILEIPEMNLPKADVSPELYTDSDRRSLCLMVSLGRFCEMFGKRNVEQKTSIYFTEAWVFNKSNSGRAIISALTRVGRSQMNQLVLDTQFIGDLGSEEEKGNFGCIFAFDEETEREKILRHVGLEVNEENLEEMKRMIKGQCWFYDPLGRVGKLDVHSLFEEFTEALRTTNKTANSLVEERWGE